MEGNSVSKVECQCCKRMMVPKVITSAPLYVSGVPLGGGAPQSSVCPFCLSPKWMLTERQALAAGRANVEFYLIMVFVLVNIVAFVRFGELAGGIALAVSVVTIFMHTRIIRALGR